MNVTGYLGRNNLRGWACLNPKTALAEKRLMDAFKKANPVCMACGERDIKKLQTHHLISLWKWLAQAATDPRGRFGVLCAGPGSKNCHVRHGHHGNYAEYYVENCVMVCSTIRMIESEQVVIKRGAV